MFSGMLCCVIDIVIALLMESSVAILAIAKTVKTVSNSRKTGPKQSRYLRGGVQSL